MKADAPAASTSMRDARVVRLFLVTLVMFCHLFTFTLLIPIEPQFVADLHGGDSPLEDASYFLGWVAASRAALEFFSNPVLGSLSDCFGRRPFLLVALIATFTENLIKGFSPTLSTIAFTTILTGSAAVTVTICTAYIADLDPGNVSKNFGLVGVALGVAFVTGPVLGGVLGVENIKSAYFIAAGMELVGISAVLVVLRESVPESSRAPFELWRINPFSVFGVLGRTKLLAEFAAVMFFMFMAQNLNVIWALYTKYRYDWGTTQLGIFLGLVGLMAILSNGVLLRVLVSTYPEVWVVTLGLACSAVALTLYGLAAVDWMMYAILLVAAVGITADPALRGLMSKHTPLDEQGELQGAIAALHTVARVIGPLIATSLFGYFISDEAPFKLPGAPFFLFAAMVFIGLLVLYFGVSPEAAMDTLRDKEERAGAGAGAGRSAAPATGDAGEGGSEEAEEERQTLLR